MVAEYGPSKGDVEEMDRFWNDIDRTLDTVWSGFRLCILGDLRGWIGDRMRASITGAFAVQGKNDNGRRVVICAEKGLCW